MTMRMDEEDIVKEKVRCKQREDEECKRQRQDSKRINEMTRAEKNRAWRMRKEEECGSNWRNVECQVRAQLSCPGWGEEMSSPCKIYQCRDGHIVCEQCWEERSLKVFCEE